jgi:hypothetical protein
MEFTCSQDRVLLMGESASTKQHIKDNSNARKPLVVIPLCLSEFGGIVLFELLHHLAQNAIPMSPLHDVCVGEETNTTSIHPTKNPVDGDGRLLLHLALPGIEVWQEVSCRTSPQQLRLSTAPTVGASSPNNIKLEPKKLALVKKRHFFFEPPDYITAKTTHHTKQPPKMTKTLPYGSLSHDGFWPLLGQNSCYNKYGQTKICAKTPCAIWSSTMAQCNGLINLGPPYQTGHVFSHHITIIMDIDDDMTINVILNNQPHFGFLWSARVRLVGEVAGLNGME